MARKVSPERGGVKVLNMNWGLALAQLMNGLQLGSIYALIALGYSMVYGIILLMNFAHGDIIMVGGYAALIAIKHRLHPVLAVLIAILACALSALIIEKVAYRPLRKAPRLSLLITAIGVSIFLQNLAQLVFGANGISFPSAKILPDKTLTFGRAQISQTTLITIFVSVAAMLTLGLIVNKTRLGKAMRCVSEDNTTAQLMGINIGRIISFTFVVGAALAGVGSVLYCCRYPLVSPSMGYIIGMKAFVAAVLGGIGSIPGAVFGGFVIGISEVFVNSVGLSTWNDTVVFAMLILVLLARPTGFFGRTGAEKV
jgi:branched-chain amino acid transport system permease protein